MPFVPKRSLLLDRFGSSRLRGRATSKLACDAWTTRYLDSPPSTYRTCSSTSPRPSSTWKRTLSWHRDSRRGPTKRNRTESYSRSGRRSTIAISPCARELYRRSRNGLPIVTTKKSPRGLASPKKAWRVESGLDRHAYSSKKKRNPNWELPNRKLKTE